MDRSSAPAARAFPLLELPDKCLHVSMQLLAQQDAPSLRCLATSHSKLYALAVPILAAAISSHTFTHKQLKSLLRFASRHGQHVRSLHVEGGYKSWVLTRYDSFGTCSATAPHLKQLPGLPGLGSLNIGVLRMAAGSLLSASLSSLQELEISDCIVTDGAEGLEAGLASVGPTLCALRIMRLSEASDYQKHNPVGVPFPTGALPSMTGLTRLEAVANISSLSHLSALLALKHLSIESDAGFNLAAHDLPASGQLTTLFLVNTSRGRHTALLDPAALRRVPGLLQLMLIDCRMTGQGGTAALLTELARLTALEVLVLHDGPLHDPLAAGAAAAAYSSLTASSNLQQLCIKNAHMPDGVWQHVFGPGKQLPHLKYLVLQKDRWYDDMPWITVTEDVHKAGAMTATDVAALSYNCTNLVSLTLKGVQQPGTPLQTLLRRLTAVQRLNLGDAGDADVSALLCLTKLSSLDLNFSSVSYSAVLQLTQLTQLQALRAFAPVVAAEAEAEHSQTMNEYLAFDNKAPKDAPPDVWAQLAHYEELRKDPEALKAWKEKESRERMARFDYSTGSRKPLEAEAGAEDVDSDGEGASSDSGAHEGVGGSSSVDGALGGGGSEDESVGDGSDRK